MERSSTTRIEKGWRDKEMRTWLEPNQYLVALKSLLSFIDARSFLHLIIVTRASI